MTEQEVKELLIKTNAIMEGHFLLTSGLHSPMYVEKFNVLQQPKYTEQLCKALAEYFADKNIDTVVGPMTGGILLAHEQTDFGVRISGDSMEPLYHTGDVAWIQKKDSLANGEIGIFYLNGNTYIKELHDEPDGVYLISLNQKYRPIQVLESDSFKIFGKVVC